MHVQAPSDAAWVTGWALVLAGFASGAAIGLFFHRAEWLGGYASWRRRMLRLGHVALVALGVLQMLYALSPAAGATGSIARACTIAWTAGSIAMPLACFAAAWRARWRHVLVLPVLCLACAAGLTLASLAS